MRYLILPVVVVSMLVGMLAFVIPARADEATCGTDSECIAACVKDGGTEDECSSW